jgi:hypothetical protein
MAYGTELPVQNDKLFCFSSLLATLSITELDHTQKNSEVSGTE